MNKLGRIRKIRCLACDYNSWKTKMAKIVWDLLAAHNHGYFLPSAVKNIYTQEY